MVQIQSKVGIAAAFSSVLFATANAHMIMATPSPFGSKDNSITLDPLKPDGSDFPCKQNFGPVANSDVNTMAIGVPQTLSFKGSAVHGGGSCQLSLTTDAKPTKDSKWMVIHSIEGNCPSDATGNIGDGTSVGNPQVGTFQYTIPDSISPGNYVFAWTWLNKIGNREFYMNCAPIVVQPPKKKRYAPAAAPPTTKRQSSFPGLTVANLASINSCKTADTSVPKFANPGSSLVVAQGVTLTDISGSNCEVGGGAGSAPAAPAAGSGSGSSAASSAAPSSTTVAQVTQTTGGIFATGAASGAGNGAGASSVSSAPAATSSAAAASSNGSGSSNAGSSGNGTGGGTAGAAGGACSGEGQAECSANGKSYKICASGYWQTMPVAAGTSCAGSGVQPNINIVVSSDKHRRHLDRHVRRSQKHA